MTTDIHMDGINQASHGVPDGHWALDGRSARGRPMPIGGDRNGSTCAENGAADSNAQAVHAPLRELAELRLAIVRARAELAHAQADAQAATEAAEQARRDASRPAELDALTELPNRVLLRDRLTQAVSSARRRDVRSALLFVDLNNFKEINDTLGHAVGDQVLKLAASRLASSVRAADTVSRHGGDEFLILLPEVGQADDAVVIADKLGMALAAQCRVGNRVVRLTASIGISLYPDDGEDADTLIERADAAMYHAKRHGLRTAVFQHCDPFGERSGSSGGERRCPASLDQAGVERVRHHALQEANENLVLAALTAQQLAAAAQQAQTRQMEALAMVAHELRSPLAPIRDAAAVLARGPVNEHLLRRMQGIIERQIAHVSRLVGDLLDVSRARTGRFRLERETLDIAPLIEQAVESCRPAMEARRQHLDVSVPAGALEVDGDPIRLTQVLCNLLDNASKYTPVSGEIGLRVAAAGQAIVLTVSDNGIGITADALPTIFDPFVRDKHAGGCDGTGLGIGLTVVRELVDAHGGNVVASSAGRACGSQFVVTLPNRQPQPDAARDTRPMPAEGAAATALR
jgi:diguanylate cyclase (GGDEF)-like protein